MNNESSEIRIRIRNNNKMPNKKGRITNKVSALVEKSARRRMGKLSACMKLVEKCHQRPAKNGGRFGGSRCFQVTVEDFVPYRYNLLLY